MNIPSQVQGIFEQYFNRILGAFFFQCRSNYGPTSLFSCSLDTCLNILRKSNQVFIFVLSKLLKCCKYGLLNGLTSEILIKRFATRYGLYKILLSYYYLCRQCTCPKTFLKHIYLLKKKII